jgi:putative hydrolases of HD superfamily
MEFNAGDQRRHDEIAESILPGVVALGEFAMKFALIERTGVVRIDGTPETDTDHTIMLSVIACSIASEHAPELDVGKVSLFALVHDLVEVYAGDVSTMRPEEVDFAVKEANEREALERIKQVFGQTSWLYRIIDEYERLDSPEARFIKVLDKSMPAITHLVNGGGVLDAEFPNIEEIKTNSQTRQAKLEEDYNDQEFALAIRRATSARLIAEREARDYDHNK